MLRRPPRSTRVDTLFPYTTLFRSRGLGDRYSLALLNGSPLPSPEPLKRVVPLDIFPSNVIDSTLVQKSYSANFPGEFGGGVINLTTKASPRETFMTLSGGIGWDSETTNQLGRSEEHTSELQSLMRISYAVFCLKKKNTNNYNNHTNSTLNNT